MSDLRALIEAARADAPGNAARAKVWAGVSTVVGEALSTASGAGAGAATGSIGAAKMLVLGTLLGGSVTVGVGVAMLLVGRAPLAPTLNVAAPAPAQAAEWATLSMPMPLPASNRAGLEATAAVGVGAARGVVPASGVAVPLAPRAAELESPRRAPRAHPGALAPVAAATPAGASDEDTLAREASSLAEARGALSRRDALSALQIVRGLRALPGRQLVPEELAVEAQALRGLGLDDDANVVETRLRVHYPDSVLGR
jgi:hypothetical protein